MAFKDFHYRWEFDLKSSPEQLWPLVADTNRFNRDTGVPSVETIGDDSGNGWRRLRLTTFGIPIEWEEQPFEWVRPQRFGVVRRYSKGPVAELRVVATLKPRADATGTKLVYEVWAKPNNLLGWLAIPIQVGIISKRKFARTFRDYDYLATRAAPSAAARSSEIEFTPGGEARLMELGKRLAENSCDKEQVSLLVEHIVNGDDFALARIRPFELAKKWEKPRREILELCFQATRVGMLDLQWNLICPLCRGGEAKDSLDELSRNVHCDGCNIDFDVNFEQSVELTFHPNASIRHVEVDTFCVGGPQVTPHIVAQQLLPPDTKRSVSIKLEEGRYRLRTLNVPGWQHLRASERGQCGLSLRAQSEGWSSQEIEISHRCEVQLENATAREQLFILERTEWSDDAATAAEVTAVQMFRDLFAREALRPGEQISVGTLTVLFTDLKNSTRLYREIGDATAFGRVMNHFDVLKQTIAEQDGALVKTIGDAVMAVFRRPANALRAMLEAQELLANPPDGMLPLTLKAGMHTGPCIAVTLNDRLDYFGSTVNLAARLEGQSTGGDVVISRAVYSDPEVRELLADCPAGLAATHFTIPLKGFDDEQFELWRVARTGTEPLAVASG
ncbi:MAG TPA: adenylate/guanylate cyclase domain-containing protein [Pyrinomonadaceae bacterium]|jgi:class 3 adenylate cyclase|nr:adenylate/guanylate cyclase domain-containing protein [Pyrinomonadaceae bacterium]